ncbi:hypothetical protein J6590_107742, partial [Homalodisca vitripennis]
MIALQTSKSGLVWRLWRSTLGAEKSNTMHSVRTPHQLQEYSPILQEQGVVLCMK